MKDQDGERLLGYCAIFHVNRERTREQPIKTDIFDDVSLIKARIRWEKQIAIATNYITSSRKKQSS